MSNEVRGGAGGHGGHTAHGGRGLRYRWQKVFREDPAVPRTPKFIGLLLATYADPDGRNAHPGAPRLALESGLKVRAVRYALADLTARGYIVADDPTPDRRDTRRRPGRGPDATLYRLAIPAGDRS